MMIKFLAHGTGSAAKAADYLTRERFPAQDQEQDQDQEKNPEEVKVLRGNPDQVGTSLQERTATGGPVRAPGANVVTPEITRGPFNPATQRMPEGLRGK